MLCKHIVFLEGHIKSFVPQSKTDVYREGNFGYIAKEPFPNIVQFLFCLDICAKGS